VSAPATAYAIVWWMMMAMTHKTPRIRPTRMPAFLRSKAGFAGASGLGFARSRSSFCRSAWDFFFFEAREGLRSVDFGGVDSGTASVV
jgi:hypothetical protein